MLDKEKHNKWHRDYYHRVIKNNPQLMEKRRLKSIISSKKWRQDNPEKSRLSSKIYASTHKEERKIKSKVYLEKTKDIRSQRHKEWHSKNRNNQLIKFKIRRREIKHQIIFHYSKGLMCCSCCGEVNIGFLTIDHLNGNGNKHRKTIKTELYLWLRRNNFPKGFQVLCYNCNMARSKYDGICPHKLDEGKVI